MQRWILFHRVIIRSWFQHWLRTLGLLLVIAIGTSIYLAIDLGNQVAIRSFSEFSDRIVGSNKITVSSKVGNLTSQEVAEIQSRLREYEVSVLPILELLAVFEQNPDSPNKQRHYFTIYGVDLLAMASFWIRENSELFSQNKTGDWDLFEFLELENGFFAQQKTGHNFNFSKNTTFYIGGKELELAWEKSAPISMDSKISPKLIIMEHEKISKLSGLANQWSHVEIILPDWISVDSEAIMARLTAVSETKPTVMDWIVESRSDREEGGAEMTDAFRFNLKAISFLSLLVTVIIVFQAMDVAVTKRTSQIATLNSLGVSRSDIKGMLWLEIVLLGFIGGVIGVIVGSFVAQVSAGVVNETVSLLYYFSSSEMEMSFRDVLKGITFGVIISFAGSYLPVRSVQKIPMIHALRTGSRSNTVKMNAFFWISIASLFLGILCNFIPSYPLKSGHALPLGGYLMCFFFILTTCLLALLIIKGACGLLVKYAPNHLVLRMGASQLRDPLSRHALTLSSIVLSVAMTVSILILIQSFERTVQNWMQEVLRADVFVRSKSGATIHNQARLSQEQEEDLLSFSGNDYVGKIYSAKPYLNGEQVKLVGYDLEYIEKAEQMSWIYKPDSMNLLKESGQAIMSETMSGRMGISIGDSFSMMGDDMTELFILVGIYREYGSELGSVGLGYNNFCDLMGYDSVAADALAIHLKEGVNLVDYVEEMRAKYSALDIISNQSLREESIAKFKQVFSITYALKFIGMIVSCGGLGTMLFSLMLERRSEISAMKLLSFSKKQIQGMVLVESNLLTFIGVFFGLSLGSIMGWILVHIINKEAFGWSLDFVLPVPSLMGVGALLFVLGSIISYIMATWVYSMRIEHEE